MLEISIVIPAFNESRRIAQSRRHLESAILNGSLDMATTEVIFVDDGSTDGTFDALKSEMQGLFKHTTLLRLPENRGKGAAIRFGVFHAHAPLTVYMDIDMAVDPSLIPALIAPLDEADMTLGSRSLEASVIDTDRTSRVIRGKAYSNLVNAVTSVNLKDTQCGFKAFRTPAAKLLFQFSEIDRFGFDIELLVLAQRCGLKVQEVPVVWVDMPGSTVRPLTDPMKMVLDLARVRFGPRSRQVSAITWPVRPGPSGDHDETTTEVLEEALGPAWKIPIAPDEALTLFPLSSPERIEDVHESIFGLGTATDCSVGRYSIDELAELVARSRISND